VKECTKLKGIYILASGTFETRITIKPEQRAKIKIGKPSILNENKSPVY